MTTASSTALPQVEIVKLLDARLLLVALTLILVGLVMIASASIDVADLRNNNPFHYVLRHGIFVFIALCAGAISYSVPLSWWQNSGWLLLAVSLLLLLAVLLPGVGKEVNGSTRWIGLGSINLQPSEPAKLFLIAYLAGYLVRRHEEVLESWWGFAKPMMVLGVAGLLLLLEPDLGASVVIGATFVGMMFLSGVKLGRFVLLLGLCVVLLVVLIQLQPYRLERLTGYTDPWEHQFGAGYQLVQSLIAFGRGEWFGVGLGNSIQKQFYLPEAHTDFVYAILAEEFGLLGSLFVISLFSLLVWRAMQIGSMASRAGDMFSAYFAYGIAILMGVQAFINMGVNMGLLPTKGLTLPLVSYGGSSLVVSCMSIGVLLRIHSDLRMRESTAADESRGQDER
jgi:cell division protein FtsW